MNRLFIFACLTVLFSLFACNKQTTTSSNKASVKWMNIEQLETLNNKQPKKVLIDVYTDWCGYCKKMDRETFANSEVARYIKKHFHAVKLNGETNKTITFQGKQFKFARQGRVAYHELAASLLKNRLGYPSLVVLDEKLKQIQMVPGYQSPQKMKKILRYFGEDYYKKMSWQKFEQR